jgi:hypothetical protein
MDVELTKIFLAVKYDGPLSSSKERVIGSHPGPGQCSSHPYLGLPGGPFSKQG